MPWKKITLKKDTRSSESGRRRCLNLLEDLLMIAKLRKNGENISGRGIGK